MKETTDYILQFLLGDNINPDIKYSVAYTNKIKQFDDYKLIIYPSSFFQKDYYKTQESLPQLPLEEWEGIPLLFGSPKLERHGETLVLYADIVASTYFLISRYEEMLRPDCRDIHGRFMGQESLPFRAGFLHRPIVDEYGKSLRKLLREEGLNVPEPPAEIHKLYLTHDVDKLAHYRNFRGVSGAISRVFVNKNKTIAAIKSLFGDLYQDPWFTFPWMFELNQRLKDKMGAKRCETIVFIKSGGGDRLEDKPLLNIRNSDFKKFFEICRKADVVIGLHPSYAASECSQILIKEKVLLQDIIDENVTYSRNHFLRSREPIDMLTLFDVGITDDFTMGYADVSGFRLGTSRSVRWINPRTKQLTSLVLHPLTVMDVSLSEERYMGLNEEEAYRYALGLIEETKKHNGDLTLLWHNTSVEKDLSYQRNLYERLIEYLLS